MVSFIVWYLAITLTGFLAFPLAYRLLPALPDRGYSLSRALGLLAWGYFFWLFTSIGILRNNPGGLLFALGILLLLSAWAIGGISRQELFDWWREKRGLVFSVEVLFLIAFGSLTIIRAANPEIQFTEKPMELAFINAILNSMEFPPHDPWLAGYAISYYYFGYVMVAMLAQITTTPAGIAFNLAITVIFGLSASGAYGVVYNLLEMWRIRGGGDTHRIAQPQTDDHSRRFGLLGPLLVLVAGNLEGFFEVLHARGVFWTKGASGQLTSAFWRWLDMKELSQPPMEPFSWMPSRFLWWWRASRVLQDYDLAGNWKEVIDEFPFFSFLLADLHPHVLAIPFVLLAIGLALNIWAGGGNGELRIYKLRLRIAPHFYLLGAIVLGGLAFLNTWDFPIYVTLFAGAYVLYRSGEDGWNWGLLKEFLLLVSVLGIGGVILYLPFYLGFSSQAGGLIPNLIYVTRGAHLWMMFGLFFVPIFSYLIYIWRQAPDRDRLRNGLLLTIGIALSLFFLSISMAFAILKIPGLKELYLGSLGAIGQESDLIRQTFLRRLVKPGGWITLISLIALCLGLLWPKTGNEEREDSTDDMATDHAFWRPTQPGSYGFPLLLVLVGGLLVLGPEFFYLRDQFGYRINTIFKFYYQAWILLGLAAAFAAAVLLKQLRGLWSLVFNINLFVLLAAALVYPVLGVWTKTEGLSPSYGWTLDGTAYLERQSPDELAAMRWLKSAPSGVVVEAVGGSYSEFARVATHSGQPTVLGWPGHESQWRGGAKEMGSRQGDIERLYRSNDWTETEEILRQYNVRYVYVGPLERSAYGVNENKFNRFLQTVFQQGQVTIYEVPQLASSP